MQLSDTLLYTQELREHYETYFGKSGQRHTYDEGPREKLNPDFYVLEIPPNERQNMFCYCTVGMSVDRSDENLIELILYSPKKDKSLIMLMTVCASYHRNVLPLNIHHTVNIGQSWLEDSKCDHGFISLPYLDGQALEIFKFRDKEIHCYWFIPITDQERNYKIENGCEALEQLFEDKELDYLNPNRQSLI